MPLGIKQNNDFNSLTLDLWQDKVFYQEREFPAGYFAAEILNLTEEDLQRLSSCGGAPTHILPLLEYKDAQLTARVLPALRRQMEELFEVIYKYPPFCYNDRELEKKKFDYCFNEDTQRKLLEDDSFLKAFLIYCISVTRIPLAISHFYSAGRFLEQGYLRRLKKRTETFFAIATHDCFHDKEFWDIMNDLPLCEVEPFSVTPMTHSTVVFARDPKHEKETVFVNRIRFVQVVDFYTYDLLNGMHHGHAPSQCQNCGRYFLTTNGHMPKYCDGIAPQNKEMTCRQYGAMNHQKEQNKQHPVYRLFNTRTATIRKHHQRGKISDEMRQQAIGLAEQYRDKALMDNAYAQNGYEQDMAQEHLYTQAEKLLK